MKLNREQIEHALEICGSGDEQCAYCCLLAFDGCTRKLAKLALALFRELTEENERLEDNLIKQSTENIMLLLDKQDIKADTVRKMQERFNQVFGGMDATNALLRRTFDQIAKELLGEGGEG